MHREECLGGVLAGHLPQDVLPTGVHRYKLGQAKDEALLDNLNLVEKELRP